MEIVEVTKSFVLTGIYGTGENQTCGTYDPNDPCPCDENTCGWVADM